MRKPLTPVGYVGQRHMTVEDVLNAFVQAVAVGKEVSNDRTFDCIASRSLVESILQHFVFTLAMSTNGAKIMNPKGNLSKPLSEERKPRNTIHIFSRTRSARELPKMILYFCQYHSDDWNNLHSQAMVLNILGRLVDFLFCNVPGVVTARQRHHLHSVLRNVPLPRLHNGHFLHCSRICVHNTNNASQCSIPLSRMRVEEPASDAPNRNVETKKIVQQLRILKQGGYWNHLPSEPGHDNEERNQNVNRSSSIDTEHSRSYLVLGSLQLRNDRALSLATIADSSNDKENISLVSNCKATLVEDDANSDFHYNEQEVEQDGPDHGDMIEDNTFLPNDNQYDEVYSARFLASSSGGMLVRKVIEDGWLLTCCSSSSSPGDSLPHNGRSCCLRLPAKVAKLGKEGMKIVGIDLMKRKDNGVMEPCDHSEHKAMRE